MESATCCDSVRIGPSEEGLEGTLDRYMMVSASVNQEMFPLPPEPVLPTAPMGEDEAPAPPEGDTPPPPPGGDPEEADKAEDSQEADNSAEDATEEPSTQDESQDDLEEQRRRLQTEYRRQVQLRNEQLRQAEDRVAELNRRFGDWYYVISEESFKSLRIERDSLIIKKGALPKVDGSGTGVPLAPRTPQPNGNR